MNSPALHHIANRTRRLPPLRVGVGGPVGSGKTTLVEMLCKAMRDTYDLVVVTNDIYTKEDQRLLRLCGRPGQERQQDGSSGDQCGAAQVHGSAFMAKVERAILHGPCQWQPPRFRAPPP